MFKHVPGWLNQYFRPDYDKEPYSKVVFRAALDMGLEQRETVVWDRRILQPRLTAWCCDTGEGYAYSGQVTPAIEWPVALLAVRARLAEELGHDFPSCLVNYYRDGQDSVGWHKDDEKLFGPNMVIASVSLGGERKFKLKKHGVHHDMVLGDGDLFVFSSDWAHTIPKTAKQVEPRISLTYRTMQTLQ